MQKLEINSDVLNVFESHRSYVSCSIAHEITEDGFVPCFNVHVGS